MHKCVSISKERTYSKVCNAERIVRIFGLGAELQLSLSNNVSAVRIIKMVVESLQRCFLDRKVTLRTLCTYDHHLRTLFMEWRPEALVMKDPLVLTLLQA